MAGSSPRGNEYVEIENFTPDAAWFACFAALDGRGNPTVTTTRLAGWAQVRRWSNRSMRDRGEPPDILLWGAIPLRDGLSFPHDHDGFLGFAHQSDDPSRRYLNAAVHYLDQEQRMAQVPR